MKKIALEEHFWTDGFPHTGKIGADLFEPSFLASIGPALSDFSELPHRRNGPGRDRGLGAVVRSPPECRSSATRRGRCGQAQRVNDFLAAEIEKHPTRYAGFAHLPMQEPEAAAGGDRALRARTPLQGRAHQRP